MIATTWFGWSQRIPVCQRLMQTGASRTYRLKPNKTLTARGRVLRSSHSWWPSRPSQEPPWRGSQHARLGSINDRRTPCQHFGTGRGLRPAAEWLSKDHIAVSCGSQASEVRRSSRGSAFLGLCLDPAEQFFRSFLGYQKYLVVECPEPLSTMARRACRVGWF